MVHPKIFVWVRGQKAYSAYRVPNYFGWTAEHLPHFLRTESGDLRFQFPAVGKVFPVDEREGKDVPQIRRKSSKRFRQILHK